MSEETRQDSETVEEPVATGPVGGERLRAAREEQQVSVLEIAKELHLDEGKVRALEANNFESLGAPVFAKGHLRKYAQLVGIDEREILGDYHELTRSAGMPPVVGERRRAVRELSPGPWIVVILILAAAAFAFWWFTSARVADSGGDNTLPATSAPAGTGAAGADAAAPVSSSPPAETFEATEPAPQSITPAPVPEEEDAALDPAPATPGLVSVSLEFVEDCWTEVTDASGERLYFGLGSAGTTAAVEGVPPVSVLLGSADGVRVIVDGAEYTILDSERRGRTARLTLP